MFIGVIHYSVLWWSEFLGVHCTDEYTTGLFCKNGNSLSIPANLGFPKFFFTGLANLPNLPNAGIWTMYVQSLEQNKPPIWYVQHLDIFK